MDRDEEIDRRFEERVKDELTPIDVEDGYREMLDECYSFKSVGGIFATMQPSRVLEECDPVAFGCGLNEYQDSQSDIWDEIDENYYDKDAVNDLREEIENEVDLEIAEEKQNSK